APESQPRDAHLPDAYLPGRLRHGRAGVRVVAGSSRLADERDMARSPVQLRNHRGVPGFAVERAALRRACAGIASGAAGSAAAGGGQESMKRLALQWAAPVGIALFLVGL